MESTRSRRVTLACALTFLPFLLLPVAAGAQGADLPPRPLRFPDIHDDFVVFAHAGDIWRAPSAGGEARRLTAHDGLELFPKISPDGRWVAFSGEHSGTRQVYVMPAEGGTPRQLTYYADVGVMAPRGGWDYWIQDWTPDGKILVRCNRTPWGERMGRYCLVDPAGGLETYLPLPEGGSASLSPDGGQLAYTPVQREFRTWKRTRGGRAQDVWIYDLAANHSQRVTDHPGTDNFPMWSGGTVYFTSDRGDVLNIYAYDVAAGGEPRQVTRFDQGDVLWPSLGPGAIVFLREGHLWRLDLATEEAAAIPITIDAELPAAVPHFIDVAEGVQGASLSPSGKRAVFDARGELFTVPEKHGPTRNLTRTQGVRETDPAWSPDGKLIAYFCDVTGEYELYVRAAESDAEARRLTTGGDVWLDSPLWSPDSERIAWNDRKRRLRVVEVASGEIVEVDAGRRGDLDSYSWSPDGRWLAYRSWHDSGLPAVAVYSLDSGMSTRLGDGLTADFQPAWSADGKYLFFLSDRDYQLRFSAFEFNYLYDRATRVYVAALDPEAPAIFPFRSDEEEGKKEEKGKDEKKDDQDKKEEAKEPLRVVAEGFTARTVALPGVKPGNYFGLRAVAGAVFYVRSLDGGPPFALVRYDLDKREEETVLESVQGFDLTPDGKRLLYSTGKDWGIADVKPGLKPSEGQLDLSGLRLKVDLRAEWRQMFDDAWRITRDFFYDPDMHGVDWPAMRARYGALVPYVGHRSELDFILGEMMGELEAGHTYVVAGDEPHVERVEGGKLGAELELDPASGRFRVARIYQGENWDDDYRSPLTEPGVDVHEGDFVLAVDGEPLVHPDNPYRLLEGKAGAQVELTVSPTPEADDERKVTVRPIADEGNLRYIDWVKSRMALTERLSGGRVGYIHLPNTAIEGNRMLQKLFYAQVTKPALIVDDRYNGGGFIPDRMIEYFRRTTMSYWAQRDVESFRTPRFAHDGPKVMLINAYSSSGGDALPYYFRQAGLGPLVGTRTWGGLIGISGAPPLVDGGAVLPPTFRFYDTEGRWVVENEGVSPDVEVIDLPEARIRGGDPSIEKAVEMLLAELEKSPVGPPDVPEPPDMTQ